jgi:hypothetical protein
MNSKRHNPLDVTFADTARVEKSANCANAQNFIGAIHEPPKMGSNALLRQLEWSEEIDELTNL